MNPLILSAVRERRTLLWIPLVLICALSLVPELHAGTTSTLFEEGFESDGFGTRYTGTTPFNFGLNDYWNRTDGSDISVAATGDGAYSNYGGDWFWAGEDTDASGVVEPVMTFDPVSTDGYEDLLFSGLFASGATPVGSGGGHNYYIQVWVSYDSGDFQKIMAFERDSFAGTPLHDTDLDENGDGVALTPSFQSFSVPLLDADMIQLQVRAKAMGGSREIAFDNLLVTGSVPAPGAFAVLGLGSAVLTRRRRRGSTPFVAQTARHGCRRQVNYS